MWCSEFSGASESARVLMLVRMVGVALLPIVMTMMGRRRVEEESRSLRGDARGRQIFGSLLPICLKFFTFVSHKHTQSVTILCHDSCQLPVTNAVE